jgi:hypothetical protein
MIDGLWNFIYFGYQKFPESGKARGIVLFEGGEAKEIEMKVTHEFVNEYLLFTMRKEFRYPLFNGYFCNIQLRLGDRAFLTLE